MIEILGDRRPIEVAAAACRTACRARRGRDRSACRAGARGSCRWRRRRCAGRRAPARAAGGASPCPSRRAAGPAEIVISLRAALGMTRRERHADHAAEAGADPGHRRRAAAAVEPRRHQIGQAGDRDGFVRMRIVEALPRRAVAGPARAEHGVLGGIDQVGRAQRRPPRRRADRRLRAWPSPNGNGDAVMPPTIDDDRRGAELGPVDPAAELHILERRGPRS